jgi:hypothetical protein
MDLKNNIYIHLSFIDDINDIDEKNKNKLNQFFFVLFDLRRLPNYP